MLCIYTNLNFPPVQVQLDNTHRNGQSGSLLFGRFDRFKSTFKDLFHPRKKEDESAPSASITERIPRATYHPHFSVVGIQMEDEALKALHILYEALHDPSILDARRHHRYGLLPPTFAETPTSLSIDRGVGGSARTIWLMAASQDTTIHIVSPRCLRSLSVSSEAGNTTAIHLPPTEPGILPVALRALVPPGPATDSDAARVMITMDFKVVRFLGEGTSGKVYCVKDRISKGKLALKVIPKAEKSEYTLSVVLQEREISAKLSDSPWFVNLWAAWHDQAHLYFAMTMYPTDLDSEMIRCEIIEPGRARFYMAEIIIALTELHSRGIVHRDIKAPNILIDREGHIVLADFGLSKDFHQIPTIAERVYQPYWPYLPTDYATSETEPRNPEELHFVAWDYRGSELEMAPEIHMKQPYSFGVDYWSAAVVLYWMVTGRPPFYEAEDEYEDGQEQDVKQLACKIVEDDLYWDPMDMVDNETKDFLERMLEKDPKKRLMISYEIPNHPYFTGINWPLMEERLLPPPWVPTCEVGHFYEPTTPIFTPGKPYTETVDDPYPDFAFLSEQARSRIVLQENDGDSSSDSDYDSDDGSVTDVEVLPGENDEARIDSSPGIENHSHDARTLRSDSMNTNVSLKATWDRCIVNPPTLKPCGPGPRGWLRAQDLIHIRPIIPNIVETTPAPIQSISALPPPETLCSTPAKSAFDIEIKSRICTPPRFQIGPPLSPSTSNPQQVTHVINGTGLLFKLKVLVSKLRTPKPKRDLQLKRLSLLT